MHDIVLSIAESPVYIAAAAFFALYPLFSALMWVWTSLIYWFRREREEDADFYRIPNEGLPPVTVLVPAYQEGLTICRTIRGLLEMDYPHLEIVIVDDGSPDDTLEKALSFCDDARVRVVHKTLNEGKALAINDVLPLVTGEFVMIIDGDAVPAPDALRWMVPHFLRNPRLAAVTGNPRVRNRDKLLAKIQTVEFSSIVSLLKRAQVVWGRVMTVSGVIGLYRIRAIEHVGLFVHDAATEDISTSWKFQRHFFDVRYEPRAKVYMQVPPTLQSLWRQRLRWAKGLAQVLRRNSDIWLDWRHRRIYPVFIEASLSIVWAYTFVVLTVMWLVTWALGAPLLGATPVPAWWGMLIATMSLVQLGVGVALDRRYDPEVTRYYAWAALYPIIYWVQMAIITVIATPAGLLRPYGSGIWRTPRSTD
ncbi:MAG: poly-beta-1,6 N-acetyl-D-glucosamine synthase [Clostridiales bacterium]|nr:poly-beta-1,6 N-acetyl-D-glucosamine synthase [Clostridiales bacterium]